MSDSLKDGRTLRLLNIVDDWSRLCPAMEVDLSLSAHRVVRTLERAGELHGLPKSIVMDNGPEFRSRVLDQWVYERGIQLIFIRPGKPTENAYAESFNGRVRDECLNQHWFESVEHARELCEAWREDYNTVRPHSSLGGLPPSEFLLLRGGGHARPHAETPSAEWRSSMAEGTSQYPLQTAGA